MSDKQKPETVDSLNARLTALEKEFHDFKSALIRPKEYEFPVPQNAQSLEFSDFPDPSKDIIK